MKIGRSMDIASPDGCRPCLIVFSDLDGTLLDEEDYSFDRAHEALRMLEEREIPLVFCTSKTRAEVVPIRDRLGNRDPFIVENGGAVYIPADYFAGHFDCDRMTDDYLVIELGTPYQGMVAALDRLKRKTGAPLRGFSDMTVDEVASRCNLAPLQARQAKMREWDEPFLVLDPKAIDAVMASVEIPVASGGRFYHLASSDKGRAVSVVMELMRRFRGDFVSVGIGNAANDIPMLQAVDIPIMVGTRGNDLGLDDRLRHLRQIDDAGPEGWKFAVTTVLEGFSSVSAM